MLRLTGTMTAIQTDGTIDEDALRAHVQAQLAGGMDGIVPCGTTGETPTLSIEEYQLVVRATVEEVKGQVPVIAGTGSNNTRLSVDTTRLARELGADAALVVTPYYNKPGPTMLEAHYRTVAAEGGLPVVLYNVPGRTGCNMAPSVVHNLSNVSNIIAVKEAAGSLNQVQQILQGVDTSTFTVLSGDDGMSLGMYSVGGHGVVSVASNVAPAEMKAIRTHYEGDDPKAAAAANARLFPLFEALFCETNPVPAKAALHLMGRMTPTVRAPLGPLQEASFERVRATIAELGLI